MIRTDIVGCLIDSITDRLSWCICLPNGFQGYLSLSLALLLALSLAGGALSQETSLGLYDRPVLTLDPGMHTAPIKRADVDRAGDYAVTGSNDKTVRIWSVRTGALLRTIRLPRGPGNIGKVFAIAISPDGTLVAAGGWTRWSEADRQEQIYLFERATGSLVKRIEGLHTVVNRLVFSPDGRYLAATLASRGLRIYDRGAGWDETARDVDYGDQSYGAAFSADGRLATTSYDGHLRLYDRAFQRVATTKTGDGLRPYSIAFSPDGDRLTVGDGDGTSVSLFDGQDLIALTGPDTQGIDNGNLAQVAWSADGKTLFAGGLYWNEGGRPVVAWSSAGAGERRELPAGLDTVMSIRPLSDGSLLVASQDPFLAVLEPKGTPRWERRPQQADMRGQDRTLGVSADGGVVDFEYEYGDTPPARFNLARLALSLDPAEDGQTAPPEQQFLDIKNWKNRNRPTLDGKPLPLKRYETSRSLAIHTDGKRFVLGSDWTLRAFDTEGEALWQRPVPSVVWAVNVTGDGRLAVAAYGDGTIRWHRMEDGRELLAFFPVADRKRWVAWTPKGYYAAAAGAEDLIGWQVNRGFDQVPEFFGVAQFREDFYRPDVVARVLETLDEDEALRLADDVRGKRSTTRDIRATRPPTITILAPAAGSPVSETKLTLTYEALSETGPIIDVVARLNAGPAPILTHHMSDRDQKSRVIGQMTLEIPPEESVVSIIAGNEHGSSEPANFVVNWSGDRDWYKPNLYVLAVGVSDYAEDSLDLNFAAKDAGDFIEAIKTQETRGLYRSVTTRLLVDQKAVRDEILDGLEWLERQTGSRDVAIVFLAGHGITDPKTGRYRFLPSDTDLGRRKRSTLSDNEFKTFLQDVSGKRIMFQDTCFSGKVLADFGYRAESSQADVDRFANELADADTGVVVFSSSTGRQLSEENAAWRNGAFTKALLEGIKDGQADFTKDLHVSVDELSVYLGDRVKDLTEGRQTPVTTKPKAIVDLDIVRLGR